MAEDESARPFALRGAMMAKLFQDPVLSERKVVEEVVEPDAGPPPPLFGSLQVALHCPRGSDAGLSGMWLAAE